jgi:hypothetical protein
MCAEVTCRTCGRPSWRGSGQHVERVLGYVAPANRCHCRVQVAQTTVRWLSR